MKLFEKNTARPAPPPPAPGAIKTPDEQDKMRVAGKLAATVLDMIGEHVRAGITTDELNTICHDYIVERQDATPAPLNYKGFPKSICTSVNHVVCHGIPSSKTLNEGDIVNVDVTSFIDGFHGDTSRTFCVGKVSVKAKNLVDITREALKRAIKILKPGINLGDIGY